ncbi:hypothetical protein HIM_04137 [Hirsutella minnesotensis 3608]|uniref:Uncharacterized protein n=1 Tax=Hirsutella minnesotensis 3608 TaxID=1043627 RepID=A0A0F7ZVD2_9HYPO|nr:hypothetical protein HIM_04137 [Hirsutella minnesotensis 3608]
MPQLASATIVSSTAPAERTAIEHQTTLTLKSPLKRNADADTTFVPARAAGRPKLQHESAVSHDAPLNPLWHRRLNTPEAGSVWAIIRDNSRSRLFVPPLLWTAEHVKLLGFRILAKEVPRCKRLNRPIHPELKPSGEGKDVPKASVTVRDCAANAAKSLSEPCSVEARMGAASDILAACNFSYTGTYSPLLYFDHNRYDARLPAPAVFASESNTRSLAYMNLDTLQHVRRQYLYRRKFRSCFYDSGKKRARVNVPVSRLIRKMLRRFQPRNEMEDPCVVAVLIALAQEQYRAQKQLSGSRALSAPNGTGLNSESNSKGMGTIPASEPVQSLSSSFKRIRDNSLLRASTTTPKLTASQAFACLECAAGIMAMTKPGLKSRSAISVGASEGTGSAPAAEDDAPLPQFHCATTRNNGVTEP